MRFHVIVVALVDRRRRRLERVIAVELGPFPGRRELLCSREGLERGCGGLEGEGKGVGVGVVVVVGVVVFGFLLYNIFQIL